MVRPWCVGALDKEAENYTTSIHIFLIMNKKINDRFGLLCASQECLILFLETVFASNVSPYFSYY